ncbi:MAG: hypothetical protein J4N81_11225 [Chloroflexi bacterium]|nr:hypothetical protein [Chloroflexota bacterium]
MATTTAQQHLDFAPWSEAPCGTGVAVLDISGPSERKMPFLARLAGKVVEFFPEIGFPALGSHHSESLSTRGKAELEMERTWANV